MSETTQTQPDRQPVQASTIKEQAINPHRPDFNTAAQSSYFDQTREKLSSPEQVEPGFEEEHEEGEETEKVEGEENGEEEKEGEEAGQTETNKATTRQEKINQYLAEISRKNAELRRREQELKQREERAGGLSIDEFKSKAKEDPLGFLEDVGLSYNDLTKTIISGKDSEEKRMLQKAWQEIENLKKEREEEKTQAQQREVQAQLQEYQNQLKSHLESKAEEYELINATKSYDAVYEVIQKHFEQSNRVLTFDQAADLVENELEKQEQARLEAILKTNKAKKWGVTAQAQVDPSQKLVDDSLTQAHQAKPAGVASEHPRTPSPQKTITGNMVATTQVKPKRRLSREESLAQAASLLKWGD